MNKTVTTTPTKIFSPADLPAGRTGASRVYFRARNELTDADTSQKIYIYGGATMPAFSGAAPATNNAYASAYQPGETEDFTGRDEGTGQGLIGDLWAWVDSGTETVTIRVPGA